MTEVFAIDNAKNVAESVRSGDNNHLMISCRDIERRLLEELGIPTPRSPEPQSPDSEPDSIARLRGLVSRLEQDAAKIGQMPAGYPGHVTFVMKIISALLPWYTRNLIQFGNSSALTVRAMLDVVDDLAAARRTEATKS